MDIPVADIIRSLDLKARKAKFIAKVPNGILEEVLNLIRLLLDF
jgi:mRNA-degrading endonuclease toxin of MazEF toxin-antitoxin module